MTNQQNFVNQSVPYSQEAEEAVIGAVLINPASFINITAFLNPEDFFLIRHTHIWRAFTHLNERNEPIDYLTVVDELHNMNWLDEVGGPAYLTYLINNTPTSVHAEVYGHMVERAATRRKLIQASDEIRQLAHDDEKSVETILSESESKLFSLSESAHARREFVSLEDAIREYYDHMEHLLQNKQASRGLPSGFRDLDQLLGGFQRSDLLVFAGRPGMGKTSFMLSVALNAARLNGRIAIFTMEMGVEQLVQRLIAMETGINMQKLRLAQLSPQETARFTEAVGRIGNLKIFIDDTPALNPSQIRAKALRLQHEHGIDMIMLDYMQLMNSGRSRDGGNRVQEMSYISRSLKELARELNVPLFSAAQLSRAVEQRPDKRPVLSDLRESGSIEQDSDIVMFLYRDVVYNEATEFPNQAEILISKHRNGPTGIVSLYFDRAITRFMDAHVRNVDLSDFG